MAGISGLNVMQWMHEQKLDTPVIMLTAAGSENIAVEAMKFGAYEYVRKEQLQMDYLPVIINSVYQQHLFRKERESRQFIEKELQNQISEVENLLKVIRGYEEPLKQCLSSVSTELKSLEKRIVPETTYNGYVQMINPVLSLQDYIALASFTLSTIYDLIAIQKEKLNVSKRIFLEYEKLPEKVPIETPDRSKA